MAEADDRRILPESVPEHDHWAEPLRVRVRRDGQAPELAVLLVHLAGLARPQPSGRWRRTCQELLARAGAADLAATCLHDLATGPGWCERRHDRSIPQEHHRHHAAHPGHLDLARGLTWAAALADGPGSIDDLAALALRTCRTSDDFVENHSLAGAAMAALGEIDDPAALEALGRLQRAIRHRSLRGRLDRALQAATARRDLRATAWKKRPGVVVQTVGRWRR